jgi:hypothetical protein
MLAVTKCHCYSSCQQPYVVSSALLLILLYLLPLILQIRLLLQRALLLLRRYYSAVLALQQFYKVLYNKATVTDLHSSHPLVQD